jgi:3-isopropylmalate/(R)-2-methylmalate dehydratase large subunit
MAVSVIGHLSEGVTAKDLALYLIAKVGTGAGQGFIVEYRGGAIKEFSMEERMTLCNMSIEWGAKAGLVAPDETTFSYLKDKPYAPKGTLWDEAVNYWRSLRSDQYAHFDREIIIDASDVLPFATWGTNPAQGVALNDVVPSPDDFVDGAQRLAAVKALDYMGLVPGTPMRDIAIDTVFIGSCTNGRLEDLRAAASVLRERQVAKDTRLVIVPGSMAVKREAEVEGLDVVFLDAGAEWRSAGCSMCLGMNPDVVAPGERTASTSNRNFEGRQGPRARTHLVSPKVAAATAVLGHLAAPSDLMARSVRANDECDA